MSVWPETITPPACRRPASRTGWPCAARRRRSAGSRRRGARVRRAMKWISSRFDSRLTVLMRTRRAAPARGRARRARRACPSPHYSGSATLALRLRSPDRPHDRHRPATTSPQRRAARIAGDVRHTPLLRLAGARARPRRRRALAQARAPAGRRQLQGARHVQPHALARRFPPAGVVIASGGNAGIAVAVAARALGVRCEVFVPGVVERAPSATSCASSAPCVTVGGAGYADALAASLARQAATGALLMHAYDQREVVAGAGTLAAEVEADAGVPDRVLVSVGGGGLIAGIAAWFERPLPGRGARARARADAARGARGRRAGRRRRLRASPPIRSARAASARSPGR